MRQVVPQRERNTVVAEPQVRDTEIADHGRREAVGVGDHGLVGVESFGTAVDAGLGPIRIDGQVEVVPIRVADKRMLLVREAVIDAGVVLIIVAADAGVGSEVVDRRERRSGRIGAAPEVGHDLSGRIDAIGGNDVAGERSAGDDLRAARVGGAGGVAEPATGGQRVIDRKQRARAVADIRKVARPLRIGRHGVRV